MIKKRSYTKSRTANRKIADSLRGNLLQHGIVMAMKYGFKAYSVSSAYTSGIDKEETETK